MNHPDQSKLERIVVALHDRQAMGDAIDKAAQLEHYSGAAVTVVETCWDAVSEEPPYHFPQEEIDTIASRMKESELNTLSATIAHYRERIADLRSEILWSKHHDLAVARYAVEHDADLIIVPHHTQGVLGRLRLPEELKLAAQARTPLLLTSGKPWSKEVNVLAAMDVADDRHSDLNRALDAFARLLAQTLGGKLHLITVNPASRSTVTPTAGLEQFLAAGEKHRETLLEQFAADHPGAYASLSVRTGSVTEVLDDAARTHEIGVVILGTAARTGLRRLLVGNTAETVLGQLADRDIIMVPDPEIR